jgi:hypothetical protein
MVLQAIGARDARRAKEIFPSPYTAPMDDLLTPRNHM